jgi:hypothetical protein
MFEAAPHPASLKLAIAGIALIAAVLFVLIHIRAQNAARRARAWPVAPGIVSASRTVRRWGLGNGVWAAGLWYVPEITYRYDVAGHAFSNNRVFLSDTGFSKRQQAQDVIDRYPPGAAVSVLYNPAHPKRACLEPVRRERRALGTAVLLVVLAAAALIAG